jgi:hypothetical protein
MTVDSSFDFTMLQFKSPPLVTMATTNIPQDPTEQEALALFKAVEQKFPSQTVGDDKWYVLTVCQMWWDDCW